MRERRASDLDILLGHALQCEECRRRLLNEPERLLVGRKITANQRQKLMALSAEDFENTARLAGAVDVELDVLIGALNLPRTRLRHL